MSITDSVPCKERCPFAGCGERCYGKEGHTRIATAGKGYAQPHQCRKHIWAENSDWIEIMRSEGRETRKEVIESLHACPRCVAAVKRLGGVGIGMGQDAPKAEIVEIRAVSGSGMRH